MIIVTDTTVYDHPRGPSKVSGRTKLRPSRDERSKSTNDMLKLTRHVSLEGRMDFLKGFNSTFLRTLFSTFMVISEDGGYFCIRIGVLLFDLDRAEFLRSAYLIISSKSNQSIDALSPYGGLTTS